MAVRLLFTAACGFAAAALAAHYALPLEFLPWCAMILLALALPALLLKGDARTRALILLISAAIAPHITTATPASPWSRRTPSPGRR